MSRARSVFSRGRQRASLLGQSTIEYVLIIGACSVPLAYAIWFFFFHNISGRPPRIVEFMSRVIDFVTW